MKKAKKAESIVEATDVDKVYALKKLFTGQDAPEITSIGYVKLPNTSKFVSYVIKSKGNEILNVEASEPDFRAIAEDEAKVNFVHCFMAGIDG